jgi:glutamate synthase (NADPH/NADH) small chain
VTVFEKSARIGGLLCYGIPDFKLGNLLVDRRMAQMQAEGVEFHPNSHVGVNVTVDKLMDEFDALVLAGGAEQPRDLAIPGRELYGIDFAMDFLTQQNRRDEGKTVPKEEEILARDKDVLVIGGGDTGSDCVGTSVRQGASSVTQLEIMPKPPVRENKLLTWPHWPMKLRTSTSHEEGCERDWAVASKAFVGENGWVTGLQGVRVEWTQQDNHWVMQEIAGSEFLVKAELILLAMGFVSPVRTGMLESLNVDFDNHGNVKANTQNYQTSINGVFTAGDMRRGQSLVVWAIREGRQCARAVDESLMGHSNLPR